MIKFAISATVAMLPELIVEAGINFYLTVQNKILQDKLIFLDTKVIICWAVSLQIKKSEKTPMTHKYFT